MEVPIPDKEKVTRASKEFLGQYMGDYYERFKKWGTCGDNANAALNGDSPVKNWAGVGVVDFPNAKAIGGDAMIALQERKHGCLWCPIRCKGVMKAGSGREFIYEAGSHKPEYETSAAFGSLLLNDNLESIVKANDICNRYGLDTISAGATIAFAVECYENGIITKEDTGGIALGWGQSQAIVAMTEKMASREGFGAVLADGVKRAAERIGNGAGRYAIHSGGQELAMHDPRLMSIFATAYECDSAPGRHTSGAMDAAYSSVMRIMDASGMCLLQWTSAPQMDMARIISAAWGREVSMQDLMKIGERISHIRQAFNAREGIDPLSRKMSSGRPTGDPPLPAGPTAGVTVNAEAMRVRYFEGMGWDLKTGRPGRERLVALGLDDVARDLSGRRHSPGSHSSHGRSATRDQERLNRRETHAGLGWGTRRSEWPSPVRPPAWDRRRPGRWSTWGRRSTRSTSRRCGPGRASSSRYDLKNKDSVTAAARDVPEDLHALFNCAGIPGPAPSPTWTPPW